MSLERELLRRVVTTYSDYGINTLYRKIDELRTQPEPVAWMYKHQNGDFTELTLSVGFEKNFDGITTPLYASPPKRKPLSDEEAHVLCQNRTFIGGTLIELLRDVEKAHGIGVNDESNT